MLERLNVCYIFWKAWGSRMSIPFNSAPAHSTCPHNAKKARYVIISDEIPEIQVHKIYTASQQSIRCLIIFSSFLHQTQAFMTERGRKSGPLFVLIFKWLNSSVPCQRRRLVRHCCVVPAADSFSSCPAASMTSMRRRQPGQPGQSLLVQAILG